MARQVLVLQLIVVLVLVVTALALATYDARNDIRASARDEAVSVARAVARSPVVREAMATSEPTALLQPYAEAVRVDTGVDFVVVMDRDRTRWSHPNQEQLGKAFIGNLGGAPDGEVYTEEYVGTLGPSIRAIVPVFGPSSASDTNTGAPVVALVAVGITLTQLDDLLVDEFTDIVVAAVVVLIVGIVGAWLIAQRLRRQTHGMGEREITRMYEYYSAVLHAVREGLLLIDLDGRVQLVNDEARRLLSLPDDVVGRSLDDLGLPPALVEAASGERGADEVYVTGDHVLVASSSAAFWDGKEVGAVVTLRDHTELQAVTGELDIVRGLTESLRAQTHEAANRLHTVVSLIEIGRTEEADRLRHRRAEGRPDADRPGRRRGGRPGRRGAAARQVRGGRRARHLAHRHRRAARRRSPSAPRATSSPSSATSSTTRSTPSPAPPTAASSCTSRARPATRGSSSATADPGSPPRRPPTPSSAAGPRRPTPGTRTAWGSPSSRRSPAASAAG